MKGNWILESSWPLLFSKVIEEFVGRLQSMLVSNCEFRISFT
jgi:hypothetical protein